MKKIREELKIEKKDIITVVGSGGKTTFLFKLGEELKNERVLLSTTTKMYMPKKEEVDFFTKDFKKYSPSNEECKNYDGKSRVYYYSKSNNGKVESDIDILKRNIRDFDYTIIEGDGSKKKLLKGWNDTEPVVVDETTKTVGIIPIKSLGIDINEENIHRLNLFLDIVGDRLNKKVNEEDIKKIVLNKNGLFKDSKGERILLINGEFNEELIKRGKKIKEDLKGSFIDKVVICDLVKGIIY